MDVAEPAGLGLSLKEKKNRIFVSISTNYKLYEIISYCIPLALSNTSSKALAMFSDVAKMGKGRI